MPLELPAQFSDIAAWGGADGARLISLLLENGQSHLFARWAAAGDAPSQPRKAAFVASVAALERGYPGGLAAYLRNARTLLVASASGANPFEGLRPEVPSGVCLAYGSAEFAAAEDAGMRAFGDAACVLVAGGLGERLGYSGIKLSLPVQTASPRCYLQMYCEQILAMTAYSNKLTGRSRTVPLAIMTSDDTHARTVSLLAEARNFGMAEGQIVLLKQEKVAALLDNEARMALAAGGDGYTLDTKPHGHGDVHTLLASSGLAAAWAAEGRSHVVFFQDTNALAFTVTQAALGVSLRERYEVNSIAVPRKAKDAVGGITRLVRPDGSAMTVNVEYNQLEPLLRANGFPDGDVNGPGGYSPYPGNINQLVFELAPYCEVLKRTGGLVPEFVNPKYADAAKSVFKKAARLECMMQDHPKVLGAGARVGFTQFDDWTYSPVKNSVEEGRAKLAQGAPGRTAAEGELELYTAGARMLRAAGCALPPPAERSLSVFGFALAAPAIVVLGAAFAPSFSALRARFPAPAAVRIAPTAALVLEGDVSVEALDLDGALVIRAAPGARVRVARARVRNAGWVIVPLSEAEAAAASEEARIRGFRIEKRDTRELLFDAPGEYTVEDAAPATAGEE